MDRLYDKLVAYCNGDYYPMHMPGHKRNVDMLMENPYVLISLRLKDLII